MIYLNGVWANLLFIDWRNLNESEPPARHFDFGVVGLCADSAAGAAPSDPCGEGGLSDLASVFAVWDDRHDESQYMALIVQLDECMSHATRELKEEGLTDQQIAAASINMLTIMMVMAGLEREERVEAGEIKQDDERESGADGTSFQHLVWAVEYFCEE